MLIAPKEMLSKPKLELSAAVLGARLTKYVYEAYGKEVQVKAIRMWSDSNVASRWIYSADPLEAYMQNQAQDTRRTLPNANWLYVPTRQNSADLITRGVSQKKSTRIPMWGARTQEHSDYPEMGELTCSSARWNTKKCSRDPTCGAFLPVSGN